MSDAKPALRTQPEKKPIAVEDMITHACMSEVQLSSVLHAVTAPMAASWAKPLLSLNAYLGAMIFPGDLHVKALVCYSGVFLPPKSPKRQGKSDFTSIRESEDTQQHSIAYTLRALAHIP